MILNTGYWSGRGRRQTTGPLPPPTLPNRPYRFPVSGSHRSKPEVVIRTQVRPSTFDSYRRNIQLHVLPNLGGVKLQLLGPEHLDHLYESLLRT
ncbi:MAG: hypothetical protein ACRDJG_03210 [Actinomycetota bacterium]